MSEVDYRPRSGWTSTARGGALMTSTDLHRLGWVDHYTGAPTTYGRMTVAAEASALRSIRNHHVNVRGWADIGYLVAFTQSGRVWDLRGISRVPAAHASPSNPRANWHGGAGIWLIGANEEPTDDILAAAQDFRHRAWLPRWSMATGRVGHQQVPGAATACPGQPVMRLLRDGTLLLPPMEDDMPTADEFAAALLRTRQKWSNDWPVQRWGANPDGYTVGTYLSQGYALSRSAHEGVAAALAELAAVRAELEALPEAIGQVADLTDEQVRVIADRIAAAGSGAADEVLARLEAAGRALTRDDDDEGDSDSGA